MIYKKKGSTVIVTDDAGITLQSFDMSAFTKRMLKAPYLIFSGDYTFSVSYTDFTAYVLEDGTQKTPADFNSFQAWAAWSLEFFFLTKQGTSASDLLTPAITQGEDKKAPTSGAVYSALQTKATKLTTAAPLTASSVLLPNKIYQVDSTAGGMTLQLPATAVDGDVIVVHDIGNRADVNSIEINNFTGDLVATITQAGQSVYLTFSITGTSSHWTAVANVTSEDGRIYSDLLTEVLPSANVEFYITKTQSNLPNYTSYYEIGTTPYLGAVQNFTTALQNGLEQLMASFISPVLERNLIVKGVYSVTFFANIDHEDQNPRFDVRFFILKNNGTEQNIGSILTTRINKGAESSPVTGNLYIASDIAIDLTDRFIMRVYAKMDAPEVKVLNFILSLGAGNLSRLTTPLVLGHDNLTGINATTSDYQHLTRLQKTSATRYASETQDGLMSANDKLEADYQATEQSIKNSDFVNDLYELPFYVKNVNVEVGYQGKILKLADLNANPNKTSLSYDNDIRLISNDFNSKFPITVKFDRTIIGIDNNPISSGVGFSLAPNETAKLKWYKTFNAVDLNLDPLGPAIDNVYKIVEIEANYDRSDRADLETVNNLILNGYKYRPVDAEETTNVNLTDIGGGVYQITETSLGGLTLALNGKTFVLSGQTNKAQNGIYVVEGLLPSRIKRALNFQSYLDINNSILQIREGDRSGKYTLCTTTEPFTLNTTEITTENVVMDRYKRDITANGGTTTLSQVDPSIIEVSGSTTHTVKLPDATLLTNGITYRVVNKSTGIVFITTQNDAIIFIVDPNTDIQFYLQDNSTQIGQWSKLNVGAGGASSISTLTDTNISNLADKDTLCYNNAAQKWINTSTSQLKTNLQLNNVSNDLQLKRSSGDFDTFTEKTTLADNDIFLIEDSQSSGAKKKVKKSTLLNGKQDLITSPTADNVATMTASGQTKNSGLSFSITPTDNLDTKVLTSKATQDLISSKIVNTYDPLNATQGVTGAGIEPRILASITQAQATRRQVGVWNAATNTPTLTNPPTTFNGITLQVGDYVEVSTAGTQFGITWAVGDVCKIVLNTSGALAYYKDPVRNDTFDAKNVWVSQAVGSDANSGTITRPKQTITGGYSVVAQPGTINYTSGSYAVGSFVANKQNVNHIGSGVNGNNNVEFTGGFSITSARNRFKNITFTHGTGSITVNDTTGSHHFEQCNFSGTATAITFTSTARGFFTIVGSDFTSSIAISNIVLPNITGATNSLYLTNNARCRISVGTGWQVFVTACPDLQITSNAGTNNIFNLDVINVTAILTSQAQLTTLLADTNVSTDGYYVCDFPNPTRGSRYDILLKISAQGIATNIQIHRTFTQAPASISVFNSATSTYDTYIKYQNTWVNAYSSSGGVITLTGDVVGTGANAITTTVKFGVQTITGNTTLTTLQNKYIVFNSVSASNLTLPLASNYAGEIIVITSAETSTAPLTILGVNTECVLLAKDSATIESDGINWNVLSKPKRRKIIFPKTTSQNSVAWSFVCDGKPYALGPGSNYAQFGGLFRTETTPQLIPYQNRGIPVDEVVDAIFTYNTSTILTKQGRVFWWGAGAKSSIAGMSRTAIATELSFPAGVSIAKIYTFTSREPQGDDSWFAIDTNGGLWSWGFFGIGTGFNGNTYGQLGLGTFASVNNPTRISFAYDTNGTTVIDITSVVFVDLAVSGSYGITVCAIDSTGQLYGWGYNNSGLSNGSCIGNGALGATPTTIFRPYKIPGMTNCKKVVISACYDGATARTSTAVLKTDGTILSCGANPFGALGRGNTTNSGVFVQEISGKTNWIDIFALQQPNSAAFMAVDSLGDGYYVGRNHNRLSGISTNLTQYTSYTKMEGAFQGTLNPANPTGITLKVACGGGCTNGTTYHRMFIISPNGKAYGNGRNNEGQLGDGFASEGTGISNTFFEITQNAIGGKRFVNVIVLGWQDGYGNGAVFLDEESDLYGVGRNDGGGLGTTYNSDGNYSSFLAKIKPF